jgi:hypothetical protein
MKNTIYVTLCTAVLSLIGLFVMSSPSIKASNNAFTYEAKTSDGKTMEMIYIPATKKLGINVKDKDGKDVEAYIMKNVDKPEGEFDLSTARRFGELSSLGKSLVVSNAKDDSASIKFGDNTKLELIAVAKPPYGNCNSPCAVIADYWLCFICCLTSSDC